MTINLALASPDCANAYHDGLLSHADYQRLQQHPSLAERPDWRCSRYLKAQCRPRYHQCLSHKIGYSVLMYALNPHIRLGVDMEICRSRDFAALLPLLARAEECRWWQQQSDRKLAFYQLWTLKEALIKASNLNFPADLKSAGLYQKSCGEFVAASSAASDALWSCTWFIPQPDWIICAVWQGVATSLRWQLYGQQQWQRPFACIQLHERV